MLNDGNADVGIDNLHRKTIVKQESEIDIKTRLWEKELFWAKFKLDPLEHSIDALLHIHSETNPERVKRLLPIMQRVYRIVKKLTGENHPDSEGLRKMWSEMIDIEEPIKIEKVEKP